MKIRLVLAITFILFSITSGIENFGTNEMKEINEEKENEENNEINGEEQGGGYEQSEKCEKHKEGEDNENNVENEEEEDDKEHEKEEEKKIIDPNKFDDSLHRIDEEEDTDKKRKPDNNSIINNNFINNSPFVDMNDGGQCENNKINITFSENGTNFFNFYPGGNIRPQPQVLNNPGFIKIKLPFNEEDKNKLFSHLFRSVNFIYQGSLWITLFEILTSFGISILNNIFGFEKMVKNKFYANMLLLKFGFKLGIPILSFIIVDFNICVYNWLASCMKFFMMSYHKILFEQSKIEWKTNFIKNKLKFIYLFNAFNIDIKLSLFGLSLCIPLTKILEALLIRKGLQEIENSYKGGVKKSPLFVKIDNIEKDGLYINIYEAVNQQSKDLKNFIKKRTQKIKVLKKNLENIQSDAYNKIFPKKASSNNNNIINN